MIMRIASTLVLLICAGCAGSAEAPIGHIFSVPPGKTAEQANANNRACEGMANVKPSDEKSTADTSLLSGLGQSLADLMPDAEKSAYDDRVVEIRSAVWVSCMREAGFGVLPRGLRD